MVTGVSWAVGPLSSPVVPSLGSGGGGGGGGGDDSGYAGGLRRLANYPNTHKDISYQGYHLIFNGDGTAFTWWYQYQNMEWWDLSTAYDLSTATLNGTKSSSPNNILSGNYTNFLTFDYNSDGTKMLVFSYGTSEPKVGFSEWNLSTAYDPSSHGASPSTDQSQNSTNFNATVSGSYGNYTHIQWVDSGNKVALTQGSSNLTYLYNASSAYDLSTVNFLSPSTNGNPTDGIGYGGAGRPWFSTDGKTIYSATRGNGNSSVLVKTHVTTPWDLSDMKVVGIKQFGSLGSNGLDIIDAIDDLWIFPNQNKMYATGYGGVDQNGAAWSSSSPIDAWIGEWSFGTPSTGGFTSRTTFSNGSGSPSPMIPNPRALTGADGGDIWAVGDEETADRAIVTVFNTLGGIVWARQIGEYYTRLRDVREAADGNVLAFGHDYGWGENNGGGVTPQVGLLAKWNKATGANIFKLILRPTQLTFNSQATSALETGAVDSMGNIWTVTRSGNAEDISYGGSTIYKEGLHVIKMDTAGTVTGSWKLTSSPLWTVSRNNRVSQTEYDLTIDATDNIYICGATYEPNNTTYPHALVFKLNNSGTLQWTKIYGQNSGASHYDVPYFMIQNSIGELILGGYTEDSGSNYGTLVKMDPSNGNITWSKKLPQDTFGTSGVYAGAIDSSDNIWVLAEDSSNNWNIVKFDNSGTPQDAWRISGLSDLAFNIRSTIDFDTNGNLILVTRSGGYGANSRWTPIKLPATLTAGTYTDFVITDITTPSTSAYSPSTYTHTTFTLDSLHGGSDAWLTATYNSGSYALTEHTPTTSVDTDSI